MKRFLSFSKRYVLPFKWWYISGFVLVAATQGLAVGIIETTKGAIDGFQSLDRSGIPMAIGRIALFATALIVIRVASRLLVFTPARMIEYQVRNDYYSRLLILTRRFFDSHETGDLVSRCSNDIAYVRAAYGFAFLQVANVGTAFAFGLGAMLKMNTEMTLYLSIPMIVAFAIIQISIRYMFDYWKAANRQIGQLSSLCLASYKGVSAIQSYCAEAAFESAFVDVNQSYLDTNTVLTKVRSFIVPLVQLVGNLAAFMVLWIAGGEVISGAMTIGQVTAYFGYIAMVMPPLLSLGWMLNVFHRAVPAMDRLDEIMLAEPDLGPVTEHLQPGRGVSLQARGLRIEHAHGGPKGTTGFQLGPIDLDLRAGKTLGIVGPVGSGKTTLVETLLRLNEPGANQLIINGKDAVNCGLEAYRRFFSYAPQKAFLFSTSLRRNLALSMDVQADMDVDAHLMTYLDLCGFDLDEDVFPKGLDTEVGEKGIMLSGGQRQRISLARALLKEADIYILDDVLSAVDHETERRIVTNLKTIATNKCFVIVSHRASAVQWTDEILVLDEGRVVDRGDHARLMSGSGYYRDIFEAQAGGADG